MNYFLHLDFETFSKRDIKDGTHNYLSDPSTEVTLIAWAMNDDPVRVEEGPQLSDDLLQLVCSPDVTIVAFNAEFERLVLQYVLGLTFKPERFLCTMALAWSLSFAGGLEKVGTQMQLSEVDAKDKKGSRLMLKFAKPRRPSKHNAAVRWTKENAPEDWEGFKAYARQDVMASRKIFEIVWQGYGWQPAERATWNIDQEVNDRGWPIDTAMVENANRILESEADYLTAKLAAYTGIDNPMSDPQFKGWTNKQGVMLPNLQKQTCADALATGTLPPQVHEAVRLRMQLKKATPKKWQALARCTHGGAIKATLEFGAAQRTQRWGGRDFQPQNLYSARGWSKDQLMQLADHLTACTPEVFRFLYDDVQEALSAGIRTAVTAPPGHTLVVCDLSSIESRVLGWLAGCNEINAAFATGQDTYRRFASRYYSVPYEQVTKPQRTFCKPPVLGCGYMLGARGLVKYAAGMGVEMGEEEAQGLVDVWRSTHHEVSTMWIAWDRGLRDLVTGDIRYYTWTATTEASIYAYRQGPFLVLRLPSGRRIFYNAPEIKSYGDLRREGVPLVMGDDSWENILYRGREQGGHGWGLIRTHAGKWVENVVQAIARDVLRDNVLLASKKWMPWATLVGHVHDEGVWLCREEDAEKTLTTAAAMMSAPLPWAPGLLLDAEGVITHRYFKA